MSVYTLNEWERESQNPYMNIQKDNYLMIFIAKTSHFKIYRTKAHPEKNQKAVNMAQLLFTLKIWNSSFGGKQNHGLTNMTNTHWR